MDSEQRKLFVGGISWETTEDVLGDYFTSFGEVVESTVVRDRITGNARGFGFVLFSDASAAEKALKENHVILGRAVEVKRAIARGDQHQHAHQNHSNGSNNNSSNNNQLRTKKIFVGGLSANVTEEGFKRYFEKFGKITDVVVMYDNVTHRPRGFGFISFDSEEAVDNVMKKDFYEMDDKVVQVKRAVPKDENSYSNKKNSYSSFNMGESPLGSNASLVYPLYSPRSALPYSGYVPFYPYYGSTGGYSYGENAYGGYAIGGYYYGCGYEMAMSPHNGFGIVGARGSAIRYDSAKTYPGYMNGGVGAAGGYHHGINGSTANGKQNQGGDDGQCKSNSVSNSS
ncbi:RNA recognition motif domain [Macleaya cordata]|uniref:RNA recognition motif domain n=1 Tax=Macleaya cordata TaxID=56857 RepID=A0A200PSN4_MACCD|nr:RNA recognition motif domain [Macleaya cordata]